LLCCEVPSGNCAHSSGPQRADVEQVAPFEMRSSNRSTVVTEEGSAACDVPIKRNLDSEEP